MKSEIMHRTNDLILALSAIASDEEFIDAVVAAVRDGSMFSDAEIELEEEKEFEAYHTHHCSWP